MSSVKVPIFGGLVTNADPEDIKSQYSPNSFNFDISELGTLKRREIATKIKQMEDRGFSSMFLWRNDKLSAGHGMEWLIYCNQRGIVYRMDASFSDLFLDSYDGNLAQIDSGASPPRDNNFLYFIGNDQERVPKQIDFQPFGDYVLVGFGHRFEPKIVQAIKNRSQFTGLYTKTSGVYIEDFHRSYPETYSIASSFATNFGTLADGDYRYNFAPIYDGVNELPIDDTKSTQISVTGGNGQANVQLTLSNDTDDMPPSLTGYRVYRATVTGGAKPAFRAIKTVNNLVPAGATDTTISSTEMFAGRHIIYTPEGFPSLQKICDAFAEKYPDDNVYGNLTPTMLSNATGTSADPWFMYGFLHAGTSDQTYGNDNTAYEEVTDPLTGATYYTGGALYNATIDDTLPNKRWNCRQYEAYSKDFDSNMKFFKHPVTEFQIDGSNEDGDIDNGGAGNYWTILTGDDLVLRVYSVSDSTKIVHIGIENCYMGKDKCYSKTPVFLTPNSHSGSTATLTWNDKTGASQTSTENIYLHDRQMFSVSLDSNGDPSSDMEELSMDYTVLNNNYTANNHNVCLENPVSNFTVTGGNYGFTYTASTGALSIDVNDAGEADGSLPTIPSETITNIRWLYSENHGGRMFVGNNLIDPNGLNEYYPDMINYSEAGQPAMIPISNYIRIRDPEGGGVQGLKSMGDSLIVFMEYGIYRLRVPSIDPSTYSVLESNEFIGCIAPHSICKVEDKVYFCGMNNIYAIDSRFNIVPIGRNILDIWSKESEKEKTIAEYDPIKECVIFRFGRVKQDTYEFNIRTSEWNHIQTQGNVSSMACGEDGYVYFGDNAYLDVTRSDGNDNDEDPPDPPDDPEDPDTGIDLYDNIWDSTDDIMTTQNTNTGFFGTTVYSNLTSTNGSNILTGSTSGLASGMAISGWGLPSGTTVTGIDSQYNQVAVSNNATEDAPETPGFATYEVHGHNNSSTFFGRRIYNSSSLVELDEYHLTGIDFGNTNQKYYDGWFAEEDYMIVRILTDNMTVESLSSTRKVCYGELLRIDPNSYNNSPQDIKFARVYCEGESPPVPILVYWFQNQFDRDSDAYVYQSGDFLTWGDPDKQNEHIVVLKWNNATFNLQPPLLHNQQHGYFVQLRDVYNYRVWDDIAPSDSGTGDDGEESGNFTEPSITTVNSSMATADTNGSGDSYVHFPYWSRICAHGGEFSFSQADDYDTLLQEMGNSPVKAEYMGTIEKTVPKFGSFNTYYFQFWKIYQQDENTTSSFRKWRPIKNQSNASYNGDVAYAYIYRLYEISDDDDENEGSIMSMYSESLLPNDDGDNVTAYGYDPLLEQQVPLMDYYPTNIEPNQAIVPMAGWLENGVDD